MNSDNANELLPIVDESGRVVGSATRGRCHGGSMLLHPVVHLHVFNARGDIYLQRRPEWKDIQPGKWDTAVGGHIDWGEDVDSALRREMREELGLVDIDARRLMQYVHRSDREQELVYVHAVRTDVRPHPSDETDGGRFWTVDEVRAALGHNIFTPNFEAEIAQVFRLMGIE